jgi:DNA polymerase III sliding clamp (beta) subunit (PCNA family)
MLGAISLCWIINSTFLESYYTREKRIALTQMYREVNEASKNNSIDSDEFDEKVSILAGTENVSLIVMDAESSTVKMHASDSSAMVRRMWDNLFGQTPSIEESGDVESRYYVYRVLTETDNYSVSIIYDSRMEIKTMELFGVLDD